MYWAYWNEYGDPTQGCTFFMDGLLYRNYIIRVPNDVL